MKKRHNFTYYTYLSLSVFFALIFVLCLLLLIKAGIAENKDFAEMTYCLFVSVLNGYSLTYFANKSIENKN